MSDQPCSAKIRSGHTWSRYDTPCGKRAKVEREGQWFCGVHDPEKRIARDRERNQKAALEDAVRRAHWAIDNITETLVEAVASFGGELPGPIASARAILLDRRADLRSCKAQLEKAGQP